MSKKEELRSINRELKRLETLDKLLIEKLYLFRKKIDKHKMKKSKTAVEIKKAEDSFHDKYWTHREKVGKKRIKLMGERLTLLGNPVSVRVNSSDIDKEIDAL